jgi:hypothetical protein
MIATLRRISLSLLLAGLSVFIIIAAMGIDTKGRDFAVSPRFVPLALAGVMLCLALKGLVQDLQEAAAETALDFAAAKSIAGFTLIVLAYILLMGTVNFHLLTFGFLGISFLYLGIRSVFGVLLSAGCLVAAEFLVFEYAFRVKFP